MTHEPFEVRLSLVLLAETLFVTLSLAMTGIMPEFITTIVFGCALALLLEAQAARSGSVPS
jgi:hypothetical protein